MTVALVTGSLAPYTTRLYDTFARTHGCNFHVLQCASIEAGRKWTLNQPEHITVRVLKGFRLDKSDISHVYVNPGIIPALMRIRPDAIIIDSFSPTMIAAGLYAIATGTSLGLAIEGARDLDPGEHSRPHAFARRLLAPRSNFAICSSEGTREMMEHWGLPRGRGVLVPHSGSWDAPLDLTGFEDRPFDFLLCGTLNERKNPMFFADVIDRLVRTGRNPRVRIVGDGPQREQFAARLAAAGVQAQFDGFLQPEQIIAAYQSAKLLAFPTRADTWGLVANEALMCGTPVLASPHAVSSRELVRQYGIGLVKELDVDSWAASACAMLDSKAYWLSFMQRREEALARYSLSTAVAGLAKAIALAADRTTKPLQFSDPLK